MDAINVSLFLHRIDGYKDLINAFTCLD